MRRDYITDLLNERYERSLYPTRQRRTQQRWQPYPALADRTVEQVAAIITNGYHPDHNTVAAALLDAHHGRLSDNDDTALTLLLVAVRPLVLNQDPVDINGDSRASLWHAVGWRITTMTSDGIRSHPTPFLVVIHGRLRKLAAKERRACAQQSRADAGRVGLDPVIATVGGRPDVVAAHAIARAQLDLLTRQPEWARLADWFEHGAQATGTHRQWLARTRRRVSHTIGYAA